MKCPGYGHETVPVYAIEKRPNPLNGMPQEVSVETGKYWCNKCETIVGGDSDEPKTNQSIKTTNNEQVKRPSLGARILMFLRGLLYKASGEAGREDKAETQSKSE